MNGRVCTLFIFRDLSTEMLDHYAKMNAAEKEDQFKDIHCESHFARSRLDWTFDANPPFLDRFISKSRHFI